MKRGVYIWDSPHWPNFGYDLATLATPLAEVAKTQGRLLGRLTDVGLTFQDQANLGALSLDVLKTSEIEGEHLDAASVRSSIARRLGIDCGALLPPDRKVEGVVDMMMDATGNARVPLSDEWLFVWHAGLFPTGFSGLSRIRTGAYRQDAVQVMSGALGRERVHFEGPPWEHLEDEMFYFLAWFNAPPSDPPLLKAGLAHLWFVTLHPFEDGNGRIARALGDRLLALADGSPRRFYSLSAQICRERKDYYAILERTQKGGLDVTPWLAWFLSALHRALDEAHRQLDKVMAKSRFWQDLAGTPLNPRQAKILNLLLEGFEGKLTSSKWATLAKCSPDTALRDLNELVSRGVLRKSEAGGRSTSYELSSSALHPSPDSSSGLSGTR